MFTRAMFLRSLFVGLLLATASRADREIRIEIHVPGDGDHVLINGGSTSQRGTHRVYSSSVTRVGQWTYKLSVTHEGTTIERTISFTGAEGVVTTRFTKADFDGAALPALVRSAKARYRAPDPARVGAARFALRQAILTLEPMVARSDSAAFWRHRLGFAEMDAQLAARNADTDALDRVYRSLFSNQPGLEYPEVVTLQKALKELHDASVFASMEGGQARYTRTLEELAALIPRYEAGEEASDRVAMGERVGFLVAGRLAPEVVRAVHARYGRMNSLVQVNARMFSPFASNRLQQSQAVNDYILGNPTHGWSTVDGQTYMRLLDSDRDALIEIGMTGRMVTDSTSTGGQQGVTVRVSSHTVNSVQVSRVIRLRDLAQDAYTISPARATVTPVPEQSASSVDVSARAILPFVRRIKTNIGTQRAYEQMPAGQAEGRRLAAEKLAHTANAQNVEAPAGLKKFATEFGSLFQEFYQLPQARNGLTPREHWLASDAGWIYSKHIRRLDHELSGGRSTPPEFQRTDLDVCSRAHESETLNTFNRQLSGMDMQDTDLQWLARSVFNYVPRPLRVGTHVPRWSARLLKDSPGIVDYDDGAIRLAVRFDRLSVSAFRGEPARVHESPFEIRAKYAPRIGTEGIYLERLQNPEVALTGTTDRIDDALAAFVQPRAEAFFADRLYPDGLAPVAGGFFEAMSKLRVREFRAEKGWLLIGFAFEGNLKDLLNPKPASVGQRDRSQRPTP